MYSKELSLPNNILGIEYLKSLKKYNSSITPYNIPRFEVHHNSNDISNNIASATAIRNLIKNKQFDLLKDVVPENTYKILMDNIKNSNIITDLSIFEKEIIYTLRKLSIEEIKNLPNVSEGLEFLIKKSAIYYNNLSDLISNIKSKRYTTTRIQRILLYALLGISKNDMEISKNILPYIRVLGFNENGKKLISEISRKNPNLKIITSVKSFVDTNNNDNLKVLLDKDIFATNVYCLHLHDNPNGMLDFTKGFRDVP